MRVPAVTDHRYARLGRLGRDALQPSDALACERADLRYDLGRLRRNGVVLLGIHTEDARGFGRPVSAHKHRAEGDRYLAEDGTRDAPTQRSFDAVEKFDDFDLAVENCVERAISTFGNGEFSGTEMQIGGGFGETLEFGNGSVENSGMDRTSSIVSMIVAPFVRPIPRSDRWRHDRARIVS